MMRDVVRWFCHVDDDTYVNVVALVKLLRQYPHYEDWYIGRPSLNHPMTSLLRDDTNVNISFICLLSVTDRVHNGLEKSLKVLEFSFEIIQGF